MITCGRPLACVNDRHPAALAVRDVCLDGMSDAAPTADARGCESGGIGPQAGPANPPMAVPPLDVLDRANFRGPNDYDRAAP